MRVHYQQKKEDFNEFYYDPLLNSTYLSLQCEGVKLSSNVQIIKYTNVSQLNIYRRIFPLFYLQILKDIL